MNKTLVKEVVGWILAAALLLSGLPPALAQFPAQATWGGTSTGTANAQVVNVPNVSSYADLVGVTISFIPGSGLTNTGDSNLQIGSLAAKPIRKVGIGALSALTGGEILAGAPATALYDGTEFVLQTNYAGTDPVGSLRITAGLVDPGYLLAYGQCISQTTYPALYAKISLTYGTGCPAGQFPVPDMRGRLPLGLDNMGGTAAGRVTLAGGNYDATFLGVSGGQQSNVVAQGNLGGFNFPVSDPGHAHGVSDPGHVHGYNTPTLNNFVPAGNGGSINAQVPNVTSYNTAAATTNISVNVATTGISVGSGGSGIPLPTLSPTIVVNYEIKY